MAPVGNHLCDQHHKVLEKQTFFNAVGILMTLAGLILAFSIFSFASSDSLQSVQRQVDNQRDEVRDLRKEMGARFDRLDAKLDKMAGSK